MYKKRATIQRIKLNVDNINKRIESSGIMGPVLMDRSMYKDPAHRSFAIFFEDGKLPDWYSSIWYDMNQMYIRFPSKLNRNSEVEVFKFHNLNNALYSMSSKL